MQKPAICPREEIDSNNFRGKIRVTLAEKLLGRRIEFGLSIFLSFETRTLENQRKKRFNFPRYLPSIMAAWLPSCAILFFFFFIHPFPRGKRSRARNRGYQAKISRSRSIGVTRACYRVEENLKDKLSRIPVTHCYQIIRQTRWSCGLIYLARHFQHDASLTHRL